MFHKMNIAKFSSIPVVKADIKADAKLASYFWDNSFETTV
jgi:hypothetical protein